MSKEENYAILRKSMTEMDILKLAFAKCKSIKDKEITVIKKENEILKEENKKLTDTLLLFGYKLKSINESIDRIRETTSSIKKQ